MTPSLAAMAAAAAASNTEQTPRIGGRCATHDEHSSVICRGGIAPRFSWQGAAKHKNRIAGFLTALIGTAAMILSMSQPARASFVDYIIRGSPTINVGVSSTEFIIGASGDKAALGSNDINGTTLGNLANVHIDRLDSTSRFPAGSGPAVAPYLNFWITDGTHFAVVANEPSDANFQPLFNHGYNLGFSDLANKVAKIYENSDKTWLPNNGVGLTFADLANYTILSPTASQLSTGWAGLTTGAPRDASNNAYGVNWVFGDTMSNYVSGGSGYVVANPSVAANPVPEPSTLALFSAALVGLGVTARKRRRAAHA